MQKTLTAMASALSMAIFLGTTSLSLAQGATVSGEVKKIDAAAGKVTLKHGPISNLDMDAMTMVFRVQDKAMLAKLKPGDKVKFTADRVNGAITVTSISK